jgi:hypothetical protein
VLTGLLLAFFATTAAPEEPPPGKGAARPAPGPEDPSARAPRWLSLAAGLAEVRRDYRPVLIIHCPESEGGFSADLKARLADPTLERVLRGFVCVELDSGAVAAPYPGPKGEEGAEPAKKEVPAAGARLGIVAGVPQAVVLDFREAVARRWQERVPRLEELRRELAAIASAQARHAAAALRVEPLLEQAEYSFTLGETREAVQKMAPLDDPKARRDLDPALAKRVAEVIERYKKAARGVIAMGESLEADRRYLEAVEVYRKAARDFPFPEVVKASVRRQNMALRRAQGQ